MERLEIYIVCGFRQLQSKHSTSQCNVQRWTCCGLRRKHWIETPNFKIIFNPFTTFTSYKFYYQINSIYKCVIIVSKVLHQSSVYLIKKVYSSKCFSIHCVNTRELKLNLKFQSNVFEDVHNKLVSAHCTVTSNVLIVTDENH